MTTAAPSEAKLPVLSTLNKDGTRRWLHPRVSKGRFLAHRRTVAYILIVLFTALPWLKMNGIQIILLDIPKREFTLFGATFLPTDTLLLMLLVVGVFVAIMLITAFFGRVWCGWACPQTVYMEFLYRPIERLFDGSPERRRRRKEGAAGVRKTAKYIVFLLVSLLLAHTFLSYFVPVEELYTWIRRSPFDHPTAFIVMASVTGLMMFDFCFFREQTCIVACPYGRFQSALLDRSSLIVGYDQKRGEPRGKLRRKKSPDDIDDRGDCINCSLCVVTCPTGIDIRDGLQMECIGCAQCIDACDAVMDKIGKPKGLIRYSSQEAMESGRRRLIRPRVVLYPLLLTAIITAFVIVLVGRRPVDVSVLRRGTVPYRLADDGGVVNDVQIKIVNRTREPRTYVVDVGEIEDARIHAEPDSLSLDGGEAGSMMAAIVVPPAAFEGGRATVRLFVRDDTQYEQSVRYRLQGPFASSASAQEQSP